MSSIAEVKDYPLSDGDIRKILGDDISILTYPDLGKMSSIDECFDSKGRCILLFLTSSPTEGHWVCLLNKKNGIHFFDPYGDKPEEQFDNVPRSRLEELNQGQPFLTHLLRASGRPVYYNTHGFQKDSEKVSTCGRHACVRCLYAPYSLQKYKSIIDASKMTPDEFVCGITADKLHK